MRTALAFIPLLAVLAYLLLQQPPLSFYYVLTSSMEPNVPRGSLVVLEASPPDLGDVAAYVLEVQGRRYVILHRVTGITADGRYVFSADAGAPYGTDLVEPERVLGRMLIAIPFLGYLAPYAPLLLGLFLVILLVPRKVSEPVTPDKGPGILRYLPAILLPLSLLLPVKGLPALLGPLYLAITLPVYAATLKLERQVRYSDLIYALLAASVIVSIDFAKLSAMFRGL